MSDNPENLLARAWLELPDGRLHSFGASCRIGRIKEGNDLEFNLPAVSRAHVQISFGADGYYVQDLRSANGTRLNGVDVKKNLKLKDGDTIEIAKKVTLRFPCPRQEPVGDSTIDEGTVVLKDMEQRTCWLFITDVAGFSGLIAKHGNAGAVERLQAWVADMRPLIESNGGNIVSYVGDAIFACWHSAFCAPEQVQAALRGIEAYRCRAPLNFRTITHHGTVIFSRSDVGEELTGQDVNFLFRAEKIAKKFQCVGMLSETALRTLQLDGICNPLGSSPVDGIEGDFKFYGLPLDFGGKKTTPVGG